MTYKTLSQITGTVSGDATRYYLLGMLAISDKKPELAIKDLEQSVALNPYNENARLELADLYYEKGQEEKAMDQYKKVTEIDPQNTEAIWSLGVSYEDLGQYDLALKIYNYGLSIDPNNIDLLDNIGMLNLIKGNYEEAQRIADKLKPLKPALAKEIEILIQRMHEKESKQR